MNYRNANVAIVRRRRKYIATFSTLLHSVYNQPVTQADSAVGSSCEFLIMSDDNECLPHLSPKVKEKLMQLRLRNRQSSSAA